MSIAAMIDGRFSIPFPDAASSCGRKKTRRSGLGGA